MFKDKQSALFFPLKSCGLNEMSDTSKRCVIVQQLPFHPSLSIPVGCTSFEIAVFIYALPTSEVQHMQQDVKLGGEKIVKPDDFTLIGVCDVTEPWKSEQLID